MVFKELKKGQLFYLGIISLVLCSSFLMSIFTPLPVAILFLVAGRRRALQIIGLGTVVLFFLGQVKLGSFSPFPAPFFMFYLVLALFGAIIFEVLRRGIAPMRGIIYSSFSILAVFFLLVGRPFFTHSEGPRSYLRQKIDQTINASPEARKELTKALGPKGDDILKEISSDQFLDQALKIIPSYIFWGVVFCFWVNFILVLKVNSVYGIKQLPFTEKDIFNFKMPEKFVIPLILSMSVFLLEEQLGANVAIAGHVLLNGLGIFYFFQGFGIYIDFLNFLKLTGIFRSLLIIFTILTGHLFIALIGLFDMWVDFRKFFKKEPTV